MPDDEFHTDVYIHTDGQTCIWADGYWFVPLDAGGEGYGCDREHHC